MNAWGAWLDRARAERFSRAPAFYQAGVLAAETGCEVTPGMRPGKFDVTYQGGALIGTAAEILAWHRESRTPDRRAAEMREWAGWYLARRAAR